MRHGKFVLNFELHDPPEYRDGATEAVLADRMREREQARDREVEELIAMGWGCVEGRFIPANWREVRGPDTETHREAMRRGIASAIVKRKQATTGS
jgi:hypothetical protein